LAYRRHAAGQRDASLISVRAQRDVLLIPGAVHVDVAGFPERRVEC
jgi:hypothetical protein